MFISVFKWIGGLLFKFIKYVVEEVIQDHVFKYFETE